MNVVRRGNLRRTFTKGEDMAVKVKAYAKINLTLEITGRTGEYHQLRSLVASADLYDVILLKKRKDKLSSITMRGMNSESIPPERNHALKAAELFSQTFGVNGANITVYKNIPIGAGLGGSSADVSGVLRGMAKLYKIDDEQKLGELADMLGSDTRYMLTGGFACMQGRGNEVEFLPFFKELHFLLLLPPTPVSTAECYQKYDDLPPKENTENFTEKCIDLLRQNCVNDVGRYLTNDLYAPAILCNPDVESAMQTAQGFSPLGTVMTGSGSGVLALFENREFCEWAKSRTRGKCRAFVIKTVDPNKKSGWRNPFALTQEEIRQMQ